MNYLYQARILPMHRPTTIPDDRGRPITFTFDASDFSRSVRYARDIPVLVSHNADLEIGNLRHLAPNLEWWVACFEIDHLLDVEFDVGQNVSVGLHWHERYAGVPNVGELSIVRHGRIPGAEITHRMPAPAPQAAQPKPSPDARAVTTPGRSSAGDEIISQPGTIIRRNIGQVIRVR